MENLCSRCGECHQREGQRHCLACHAAHMREWRKTHPLTGAQLTKAKARGKAGIYRKRGKLTPQPCEQCASVEVEMHHDDYSEPLRVRWLCKAHHVERHQEIGGHT